MSTARQLTSQLESPTLVMGSPRYENRPLGPGTKIFWGSNVKCIPVRAFESLQTSTFLLCALVLSAAALFVGCPKDPPAGNSRSCPANCPIEWCNPVTFECEVPNPSAEPEPDQSPDAEGEDGETDQNASGDGAAGTDGTGDDDTAEDPDDQVDSGEEDGEEPETGQEDLGEGDIATPDDVVPDTPDPDLPPDAPRALCPDHLEPNGAEAAHVHSGSLLVGAVEACGAEIYDPRQSNGCSCDGVDCCQCGVIEDLALCGLSDVDLFKFDLLAGDVAVVRIVPDEVVERCDFFATLTHPDGDTRNSTCDEENGRVVSYVRIEPASTADGDPGVVAGYTLRVRSSVEQTIPYHLHIQVEPVSRNCAGDAWDADWEHYNSFLGSESECTTANCEGGFDSAVHGRICPWDAGDYVKHVITSSFPNTRTIRLSYDETISRMTGTLYQIDVHGNPTEVGRMCDGCDDTTTLIDGSIKHTFEELWPATYQLRVTTDNLVPAEFDVFFLDE